MRDYFRISGRLNRKPYWLRTLLIYAIMLLAFLPMTLTTQVAPALGGDTSPLMIVTVILFAVVFIIGFILLMTMSVRRLHDRNKSGWWLLFFMGAPGVAEGLAALSGNPQIIMAGAAANLIISLWFLIEAGFLRGTVGPNRYGHDPLKGPIDADVFT